MALTEDDDFVALRNAGTDREWVGGIESTLDWCAKNWGLHVGVERQSGLDGYVVDAHMDNGAMAVLKLRRPDEKMTREADTLEVFDGAGSINLMERNDELGALLLERGEPGLQVGECLDQVDPDQVMCDLVGAWEGAVAPSSAVLLSAQARRWADILDEFVALKFDAPLEASVYEAAASTLRRLADTQGPAQLLHGDLHLGNVISSTRRPWLTLDPRGLNGEAMFDLAWWLRDPPLGAETAAEMSAPLAYRVEMLVKTGIDGQRALDWAHTGAVVVSAARTCAMSAWDARRHAECAKALRNL